MRAHRPGNSIGRLLAAATHVTAGYVWATHGLMWGAAVIVIALVGAFALLGLFAFAGEQS